MELLLPATAINIALTLEQLALRGESLYMMVVSLYVICGDSGCNYEMTDSGCSYEMPVVQ